MRALGGRIFAALLSGLLLALAFPLSLLPLPATLAAQLSFELPSTPALGPLPIPLPNALMPQTAADGYVQISWLAFVALLPLLLAIRRCERPIEGLGLGLASALLWNFLSLMWFSAFGAAPVILLSVYYGLPLALFGWLAWWLLHGFAPTTRSAALALVWGLPLVWTGIEYLRSFGFWAFPWLLLGYTQARIPLFVQTADLGGVYLVSFLVVLVNSCLLALWPGAIPGRLRLGQALRGALLLLAALGYGFWRLHSIAGPGQAPAEAGTSLSAMPSLAQELAADQPEPLHLALVQGGRSSLEKWTPESADKSVEAYVSPSQTALRHWKGEAQPAPAQILPTVIPPVASPAAKVAPPASQPGSSAKEDFLSDRKFVGPLPHTGAVKKAGSSSAKDRGELLFIWPESCIESPYEMDPRHVHQIPSRVRALVRNQPGAALLFGAIGYPRNDQELENGCLLLDSAGNASWPYSKIRLVPFGETVPFREVVRFLEYPWPGGDISAGRQRQPFNWQGRSLGALICYDNVFGFIPREQARQGAQYLFLMTNNSWYKLRSGIRQHCDIDVLRAVECRRPLSRASTTGWSQAIDPAGRILAQTTAGGPGLIQISLPPGPPAGLEPDWLSRLKAPGRIKLTTLSLLGRPAQAAQAEAQLPAPGPESGAEAKPSAAERAKEQAAEAAPEPRKERGQQQASAELKFTERPRPRPDLSSAAKQTPRRPSPSLTADSPYLTLGDLFAQLCLIFSLLLCAPPMLRGRSEGWL